MGGGSGRGGGQDLEFSGTITSSQTHKLQQRLVDVVMRNKCLYVRCQEDKWGHPKPKQQRAPPAPSTGWSGASLGSTGLAGAPSHHGERLSEGAQGLKIHDPSST